MTTVGTTHWPPAHDDAKDEPKTLLSELKRRRENKAKFLEGMKAAEAELADLDRAIAALSPAPSEGDALGWEPIDIFKYPASPASLEGRWADGHIEALTFAGYTPTTNEPRWMHTRKSEAGGVYPDSPTHLRLLPSEPAAEAKGGGALDDGEATRMAHSIMPGSGATFKTNAEIRANVRPHACTCHPDDNPPTPCQYKFALTDCLASAAEAGLREYTMENGERRWAYEVKSFSVGIATPTERTPDTITISSSEQHAEESARAQDLAPLFPPEREQPATPEQLIESGAIAGEAYGLWRKLAKVEA